MKIYKITETSDYLGVSINTLKALMELGWTPPAEPDADTHCIFENGCTARTEGCCALTHCPKFTRRYK